MPESYAGITVPEGSPDALRTAAAQFVGVAGSLQGASAELRGLPSSLTSWYGPASVVYAGSCTTHAGGVEAGGTALETAAQTIRAFASELEQAQDDARQAIEDARDARRRIEAAQAAIEQAQADQAAASARAEQAAHALAVSGAAGTPSPFAQAEFDAAGAAASDAAAREAEARRRLEEARDDFERAQRRGQRAEDRARDAATQVAGAFGGPAGGPGYAAIPGPSASPYYGNGSNPLSNGVNDGAQWWNEDQFASNIWPFHPANDDFLRGKWGVDQLTGFGSNLAEAAAFGAARAAQELARRPITTTTITHGAFARTINGRLVSAGTFTSITQRTTPRPPSQVAQLSSRASGLNRLGWAVRGGGSILAGISGGVEQWHADAGRSDLTTTDRVGRAAGVGTYMASAAMAGAIAGSFIPVGGTLAGAVVGAGVGLVVGAVANSIEPAKEFAANAGQAIANGAVDLYDGAVDTYNDVKEGVQTGLAEGREFIEGTGERIAEGMSGVADRVRDIDLPDIDMPDVDIDLPGPF
jgi:hypothetical protein